MSKIVFFSIPAHGHTNPTIEVVRQLVQRGHEVCYYSFDEFREKIEEAGARYISCDSYLPPAPPDLEQKVGRDFAALIEMVADTTLALDETVCQVLEADRPDCIVSDSLCFWGKLFALKLNIPYICSTTTFAFNQHTAKLMNQGIGELLRMVMGLSRINGKMKLLREHGYAVDHVLQLIQNDNDNDTIVYTTRKFQPMAETFGDRYAFVGPSIAVRPIQKAPGAKPLIYISLGTVLNRNSAFYRNCIAALRTFDGNVILSVGERTDRADLGHVPESMDVQARVNQVEVLGRADLFLTHCGMNSVSEALSCGVPMVLYPQHAEEELVARRVEELGAGLRLARNTPEAIGAAIAQVLSQSDYRENALQLSASFRAAGGAEAAADAIERVVRRPA